MKSEIHFFDSLPIHPQPFPLESFTGYLTRLAETNGIQAIKPWSSILFPSRKQAIRRAAADFPPLSFGALPVVAHCTEEDLRATTFFHVGRKFGRSTSPQHLGRFLRGSIAPSFRYCPQCLSDCSFYSLTWRFLNVQGCYIHGCQLHDQCPQCERSIPLFAAPLKIGICPFCASDLRRATSRAMQTELQVVSTHVQDVTFLLQPHALEVSADQLLIYIGKQLMRARQSQDLSRVEMAGILKLSTNQVAGIESGNIRWTGATLEGYLRCATVLGTTLSALFAVATQEYQSVGGDSSYQSPEHLLPLGERREQELLMRVQHIEQVLRDQGVLPTPQAISDVIQVDVADLRYYPTVRQRLNQLLVEQFTKCHPLSSYHVRESELIHRVLTASEVLTQQGKLVTQQAIAEVVGISRAGLSYYPTVRTLLKNICSAPYSHDCPNPQVEENLVALIQRAMETLRAQGKTVTQAAVSRVAQKPLSSLRYYPRVRLLLEQIAAENRQVRTLAISERESELLNLAQQAIEQLRSEGLEVTQHAIAERIGIALSVLRRFAQIRSLIQIYAMPRVFNSTTKSTLRQHELMIQVLEAIDELRSQGQPITQQAIGKLVGMTPAGLRRYPQVKAILATLVSPYQNN